jgi:hypothetical protein
MTPSNKSIDEKYIQSSRAYQHLVTTFSRQSTPPATGWDKTLSTQLYSARLTRQEKNKDSKDMHNYIWWCELDSNTCKRAY